MKALFFENKVAKVVALQAASLFDRYAALGRLSPLRYAEVPEPQLPGPRWLKVRNLACGLCGTDLHFMFMDLDPKSFPAAVPGIKTKFLGHELVAEVLETGAEVDGLEVGDRVAMRIDWPSCNQLEIDPPCPQCAAGSYMLCENLGQRQLPLDNQGGGFSPRMVMHRSQPYTLPEGLDRDTALLLEPLASAVHGVLIAPPEPGEHVLVIGAGTIGLLTVVAIRSLFPEVRVSCLSRHEFQGRVARRYGAEVLEDGDGLYRRVADRSGARYVKGLLGNEITLGGFDRIYDSVGNDTTFNNALRWTRARGTVVLLGINFKPGKVDYTTIWNQELQVTGINCHAEEGDRGSSFDVAAELLTGGVVAPGDLITHRFPVRNYKEAVKAFLDKKKSQAIKIVLEHERANP